VALDRGVLAAQLRSAYVRLKGHQWPPDPPAKVGAIGPPDFVGVGVQKAGTSWWYDLITAHPAVRDNASGGKELHFFDRYWDGAHPPAFASDASVRADRPEAIWRTLALRLEPLAARRPGVPTHQQQQGPWGFRVDVDAYHRFFPVRPGSITGEWTPRYMADWWVPGFLAAAAPDARLLVIVRDPVERFRSGLTRITARRWAGPNDSAEAFERGRYASQLKRLRDWFPASQMLILQYERCVAEPATELRRTYEFLGLDNPEFTPEGLSNPVNKTVAPKITLDASWLDRLRRAYESEVLGLVAEYPDIDFRLWPNFASL
jgi:hypothetical protein